jgi:hypothetical protein
MTILVCFGFFLLGGGTLRKLREKAAAARRRALAGPVVEPTPEPAVE